MGKVLFVRSGVACLKTFPPVLTLILTRIIRGGAVLGANLACLQRHTPHLRRYLFIELGIANKIILQIYTGNFPTAK